MNRTYIAACISILLFLADFLLYVYQPLGEEFYIVGDSTIILFSFLAIVSGFYAYRPHGFKSTQGKALLFITLGVIFWFLGETTWGIYEVVLGIEAPVASVADIFWLIGYPFFLIGSYFLCRLALVPLGKKKYVLAVIIIAVCSFMLYLAFPTFLDIEMSLAEKLSTAGYVVGDMLLLVAMAFAVSYLWGGKFTKPWSVILIAILLSAIADIYYMNFIDVYETGNMIDLLWDVDYILMTFGFFYHRETAKEIVEKAKEKPAKTEMKPYRKT